MFQSNDWNLDEDYMKDFENINTSFDESDRNDLKKRKIDDQLLSSSSLNIQIQINDNVSQDQSVSQNNIFKKKKKVLELFKKTQNDNVGDERKLESSKEKESQHLFTPQASNRRQRVAELFTNKSSESQAKVSENKFSKNPPVSKPLQSQAVLISESQSQKKENKFGQNPLILKPFQSQSALISESQSYSKNLTKNSVQKPKPAALFDPKPGGSKDSERWMTQASDVFSVPIPSSTPKMPAKSDVSKTDTKRKNVLDCFKKFPSSILPKRTLVRKFPGPAGLLPDEFEEFSVSSEVADSDSLKEDSVSNFESSGFFSQRTKNLFNEGAWQLMTDDLPVNFLNGYDIASVKQKLRSKKFQNNKVPFMAGIVQSIDYSSNNPKIVLKDFSGEIECCLHCKIINKYPNVLEYGVVVLLRDVGIITSKTYLYAMVSLNSLVGIYNHKERVISTTNLENIQSAELSKFRDSNFERESSEKIAEKENSRLFESLDDDFDSNDVMDFFEREREGNKENKSQEVVVKSQSKINDASQNQNSNKLDKFFDMDDQEICGIEEHLSQVDQSFFTLPPKESRKIESFKCNKSSEATDKVTTKQDKISGLKKFNFQRKVPSAIFNAPNAKTVEKDEPKRVGELSKNKSKSGSLKFKIQQFKRQTEKFEPENTSTRSQCSNICKDDLFSCDDDILMSQIELDSFET